MDCLTTTQSGRCPITTRAGDGCRAPLFRAGRCYAHHAYHLVFGHDPERRRRTRRCVVTTLSGTRCWAWTRYRAGNGEPVCHNHRDSSRFAPMRALLRGARLLDDLHPGWMDQIGEALAESR